MDHLALLASGKCLDILFRKPILAVNPQMQPELNTVYSAFPGKRNSGTNNSRIYFLVYLESGDPLIVYPDEFEIIGVSENQWSWKPYKPLNIPLNGFYRRKEEIV